MPQTPMYSFLVDVVAATTIEHRLLNICWDAQNCDIAVLTCFTPSVTKYKKYDDQMMYDMLGLYDPTCSTSLSKK